MVKIALNYALMIEQIRRSDYSSDRIIELLEQGNSQLFNEFGDGIPDWETLLQYYEKNKAVIKSVLYDGYEIGFLTKGALKSLLRVKYQLVEDTDFQDTGEFLNNVSISDNQLSSLRSIIAKNWTIKEINSSEEQSLHLVKIELTNKLVL